MNERFLMKKWVLFVLFVSFGMALFAEDGRTFEVLTKHKYQNVKIDGVTWKGIRICHSEGNCYITDADLSSSEQKLLKNELKSWKTKLSKHNRRYGNRKKLLLEREDELMKLRLELSGMGRNEIGAWFQKRIGTDPYQKDFKTKFDAAYASVKCAPSILKDCEARLSKIEAAEFKKMEEVCLKKYKEDNFKEWVGVGPAHPSFAENLQIRFPRIPAETRVKFINKCIPEAKMVEKREQERIRYEKMRAERRQRSYQSVTVREYTQPTGYNRRSNYRCADCTGRGMRNVYFNGRWYQVKCRSCNGTGGNIGTNEYIDSSGMRHRSQMEQSLGRMLGTY